jgi:4-amino-4-deoxy-L-arabinose transferase-like glycosyltransferase
MPRTREILLLVTIGILASTLGLRDEFIQFDSRSGVFLREMMQHGATFFPTTYGRPYPDYPATATILSWGVARLTGNANLFATVFPVSLAVAITLLFTYLIGLTHSPRLARWSVVMTLATFGFVSFARSPILDHFVTAAATCSFYLAYSAALYKRPRRLWWIPLAWVAGFTFRGPIGLVIPVAAVFSFYALQKTWKHLAVTCVISLLLLGACCGVLWWAAYQTGGETFAWDIVRVQVGDRLESDPESPQFFFYFLYSLGVYALSFPLAVLVVLTRRVWRRPEKKADGLSQTTVDDLPRLLLGWILIILIGMTIPTAKMIRYVLPIVPASALLSAFAMSDDAHRWLVSARNWLCRLSAILPWAGAAAALVCAWILPHYLPGMKLYWWWPSLGLLALGGYSVYAVKHVQPPEQQVWCKIVCGVAAFWLILTGLREPIFSHIEQVKPFVLQVECRRAPEQPLVFYQIGPDQEDIKYMANCERPLVPRFVQTVEELLTQAGSLMIARANRFAKLPPEVATRLEVLYEGRLGHKTCLLFRLRP